MVVLITYLWGSTVRRTQTFKTKTFINPSIIGSIVIGPLREGRRFSHRRTSWLCYPYLSTLSHLTFTFCQAYRRLTAACKGLEGAVL